MIELIYISQAKRKYYTHELLELLETSRENNQKNNITGMLLYDGLGTFIQVLEGECKNIEVTYEKIGQDFRHENVFLLNKSNIIQPNFVNWSMGFHILETETLEDVEGFTDFLRSNDRMDFVKSNGGMAKDLLMHFKGVANRRESLHI